MSYPMPNGLQAPDFALSAAWGARRESTREGTTVDSFTKQLICEDPGFRLVPSLFQGALSSEDVYYLLVQEQQNTHLDDDPQAASVYAAEDMVISIDSPTWAIEEIESAVHSLAEEFDLRVRVRCRPGLRGASAFVGRGGGVINLPADWCGAEYRVVERGQFVANVVLHEFAHILTAPPSPDRGKAEAGGIESHGPEFVGAYLMLLSRIMDTRRAIASLRFLGVEATCPDGDAYPGFVSWAGVGSQMGATR